MDPVRDKYIFNIDIPRSHELYIKKMLRSLLYTNYPHSLSAPFLDPIRGFTQEPKRSEPHGSVLLSVPRWYG